MEQMASKTKKKSLKSVYAEQDGERVDVLLPGLEPDSWVMHLMLSIQKWNGVE